MRADLSAYADLHALAPSAGDAPASQASFLALFRSRSIYAGALSLVLIVASGAQATFASEAALPGDILYPVKVALAEPVALALSSSGERKAELAARFASRRVDEAAALSTRGELDEETADDLAERFDEHVEVLAKETEALEAHGDIAASLAVRSSLGQELSEKTDPSPGPAAADSARLAIAAEEPSEPEDVAVRFKARIHERARVFAIARESLADPIAAEPAVLADAGTRFAAMRAESEPGESGPSARLSFTATLGADAATLLAANATTTATSTATTTASSTDETDMLDGEERRAFPAARFFAPFWEPDAEDGNPEDGR